ncbi:MAG TPA: DUF2878 family protein [Prolixibacteraceae bacterium]|nr:DUF2878 family protein [Prolixibacteraceae bacterium]
MNKTEKIVYSLVLGFIPLVFLFVAIWFAAVSLFPEKNFFYFSFAGLAAGFLIDFFFLKKGVLSCPKAPYWILIVIFLFYHIGMLGFFMGVPIFNAFMGILAGYYIGRRLQQSNLSEKQKKRIARNTALFTPAIMMLICISSATFALIDPTTPSNLEGMFRLRFNITQGILISFIIIGGVLLVGFTHWSTRFTIKRITTPKTP